MNQEKIKELFENEEFVKELFSKETPEEVQEMLAENDVKISVEEIVKLRDLIVKKLEQGDENLELTEEELEEVSGGFAGVFLGVVFGIVMAAGVAAIGYQGYRIHRVTRGRW